jgi:hypothetical protein
LGNALDIYLRLALYRIQAWQHIGLAVLFVDVTFRSGRRIYLFGWCNAGACIRYCAHHCAPAGSACVYGFEVSTRFEGGTGTVSGRGSRELQQGSKPLLQKNILLGPLLHGISIAGTAELGWTKGCYSAACKYQYAIFTVLQTACFKLLMSSRVICVICMCASEYVAGHELCVTK